MVEYHYEVNKLFIHHLKHLSSNPKVISKDTQYRMKEHDNLFWKMETHMLMHELTYEYYWQRAFIMNLIILILGLLISAVSFTPEAKDQSTNINITNTNITMVEGQQEVFEQGSKGEIKLFGTVFTTSVVTGLLGVVITFFKALEKYFNYNSRADMHESATSTLKDICDDLFSTRIEAMQLCDKLEFDEENPPSKEKEKDFKEKKEKIKIAKAKFDTMQKSCKDMIPSTIAHEFLELREVFKYASYDAKYFLYRKYYHKVSRKLQRSVFYFNPPCVLACFQRRIDGVYKELFHECESLLEKLKDLKPEEKTEDEPKDKPKDASSEDDSDQKNATNNPNTSEDTESNSERTQTNHFDHMADNLGDAETNSNAQEQTGSAAGG